MPKSLNYFYWSFMLCAFICVLFYTPASGEGNPTAGSISAAAAANSNNTGMNSKMPNDISSQSGAGKMNLNSSNEVLSSEKIAKSQFSDKEKKPKTSKKKAIYIFDTIVTGLMHILIAAFAGVVILIILKWFFLERQIK